MTFPVDGPATVPGVKALLSIEDNDSDTRLTSIVAAVNATVLTWPVAVKADGAADWAGPQLANIVEGANLLAARVYRRKNSVDGVQVLSSATLSAGLDDPELVLLLELNKPAVG